MNRLSLRTALMLVSPMIAKMMSMTDPVMTGQRFVLRFILKCSLVVAAMLLFLSSRANDTKWVKM